MVTKISKIVLLLPLAVIIALSIVCSANAGTLTFGLDMEYSGGVAPNGTAPWITATFIDVGPNVQLSMSSSNLTGTEKIKEWYFNFNDDLDLASLNINPNDTSAVGSSSVTKDKNNLQADGDGKYDFMFAFSTSGNVFSSGETVVYDLGYTGGGSFDVSSFNYLSSPSGGHGPFYSASHVQNTGDGSESGWIAVVPEPISSTLFIVGSAALGFRHYRRKK